MKTYIKALHSHVPEKRLSNDDIAKIVDTTDEWIYSHTGIKYRHLAESDVSASDLAYIPCKQLFEENQIDPESIDLIIVATTTPDYIGFPSTACMLQEKIKARNAGAMDIAVACSGFIYGLEMANSLVKVGIMKNILVVAVELLTHITDWEDRGTCVLFGDGAGVALVCENTGPEKSEIVKSILRADGTGWDSLYRKVGGSRNPFRPHQESYDSNVRMDGQRVYNFAVKAMCDIIKDLFEQSGLSPEDIAYVVPHQANARIIRAASKRLKIPLEKFFMNIEEYANTSAASIPIALDEMNRKKLLHRGDYIITVGFGGGLTYGGNLIRW
ncbi:MAG: ketoacyl-ACP synthase III [Spirochaetales bacterium]|nr:ketoacyl-ACP synthase III [Spirochaetales bacterium]